MGEQVVGVEDVTGFVRLLLDPGMFGNDDGQLSKTEFITLFDWWSSIDTSISAELKSALFAALDPKDDEVPLFALARSLGCMPASPPRKLQHGKEKKGIGVARSAPRLRLLLRLLLPPPRSVAVLLLLLRLLLPPPRSTLRLLRVLQLLRLLRAAAAAHQVEMLVPNEE